MLRLALPFALPLSVIASAFAASLASAQADQRWKQRDCVYLELGGDRQRLLAAAMAGTSAESAAAQAQLGEAVIDAAVVCAGNFGWGKTRSVAGMNYATARVIYERRYFELPGTLYKEDMAAALESLSPADRAGFTPDGQTKHQAAGTLQAWYGRPREALKAKGVKPEHFTTAVNYLWAEAELTETSKAFYALMDQNIL